MSTFATARGSRRLRLERKVLISAFSFGNRWVGIVALGTPPPPEPLHKMALRLREQSRSRKVRIDDGLRLPADTVLPSLVRIRQQVSLAGLNNLADECLTVERMIRSGRKPVIRPWLRRELKAVLAPTQSPVASGNTTAAKATLDSSRRRSPRAENIVATRWAESCPHAPDSILLPELPAGVADALESLSLSLDGNAQRGSIRLTV